MNKNISIQTKSKTSEANEGGSGKKPEPLSKYEEKLQIMDLPTEPLQRQEKVLEQGELARLACALTVSQDLRTANPLAMVTMAKKIWDSAGSLLFIENQALILAKGILIFNEIQWKDHAQALIAGCEEAAYLNWDLEEKVKNLVRKSDDAGKAECNSTRRMDLTKSPATQAAIQKSSEILQATWKRLYICNEDILRVLFPGQNETLDSRLDKFHSLVIFIKTELKIVSINYHVDLTTFKVDFDNDKHDEPLSQSVCDANAPIKLCGNTAVRNAASLLSLDKKDLKDLSLDRDLADNACVARWLVVMRREQISTGRVRGRKS